MLRHKLAYKTSACDDYNDYKIRTILEELESDKFEEYRTRLLNLHPEELTLDSIEQMEIKLIEKHLPGKTAQKMIVMMENFYLSALQIAD